tara:strand:+ start:76 stop:270 length:195 start_codon:yes stop_codon:yes gene_type:complete
MLDKAVIEDMLGKVIRGHHSHGKLVEVFVAMAADLGVEQKVPEPEPEPEPTPKDDENKTSFFKK